MSETAARGDLLGFTPPAIVAATSDEACLQAMLDVEAAIARAAARAGVIPSEAAAAITDRCRLELFDLAGIGARAAAAANPVVPLVADLTALVPAAAAAYVHSGATSQDVVDTALSLISARLIDTTVADLAATADRLAILADAHRGTLQIGRTLLQHATPTAFGLVCAGWLTALDEAGDALLRIRHERLAVQFGGPVGTLAALGADGAHIVTLLADELDLASPTMPWHTNRGRIGELAGALGVAAGALATIALDVSLLAQTDVAEVSESASGASSAMPHKRNPVRAVIVTAVAHRVPGLVATLLGAAPQELQRAAGRWQAEWPVLVEALRATATAAHHGRALIEGLHVDVARMRANLDAAGDVVLAESAAAWLTPAVGRARAHAIVSAAAGRAVRDGTTLRAALMAAGEVAAVLDADARGAGGPDAGGPDAGGPDAGGPDAGGLGAALRPEAWLGSADIWIDRARHVHEHGRGRA